MSEDLKKGNTGSGFGVMNDYVDQDGQPVSYVDLSATLRITVGPKGPSYTVLIADRVLFEGEMDEMIWDILGCCYPELAERIKALCIEAKMRRIKKRADQRKANEEGQMGDRIDYDLIGLGKYELIDLGNYVTKVKVEKCVSRDRKDIEGKKRDLWLDGLEVIHDGANCLLTLPAEIQILASSCSKSWWFNVVVGDFPVYRSDDLQPPLSRLAGTCLNQIQDQIYQEMQLDASAEKRRKERKW